MTQADFTIANQTFPNTRTELNTSLQALATNSAGNSAPSTTFPNQWWFDSDGDKLYMRNKDNDAWVEILTIGATSDDVQSLFANVIAEGTSATGVTIDGLLIKDSAVGASGTATSVAGIPFFSDTSNGSIYTHDVSGTDDTAQYNTAYGLTALDAITTGDYNVAIGYNAGSDTTTGERNTFIGNDAGKDCIGGGQNVAIGDNAGGGALSTAAGRNIMIGRNAGTSLTSGTNSIFIGFESGDGHDAENHNLGIGTAALGGAVAGGEYNVAVGNYTLDALTSGDYNVAVGYGAGSAVNTGTGNIHMGYNAGADRTSGSDSVFLGYRAGHNCTTGADIVFIGKNAGDGHDTEGNNLGIGSNALGGSVAGGEYNVAVGNNVLDALTSGDNNVAMGYNAGTGVSTGGHNVIIGNAAGAIISSGGANICIGSDAGTAGTALTTGDTNIFIGQSINAGASGRLRSIVIGTTSSQSKGDNTTFISANGGDSFNGKNSTTWDQSSDRRIKKNIVDNNTGLDAINKIQVRNFEYRTLEEITDFDSPEAAMVDKQGTQLGAIAQEIEEILPDLITETSQGVKTLNADNLTWYLINAVKELSAEIKVLKGE